MLYDTGGLLAASIRWRMYASAGLVLVKVCCRACTAAELRGLHVASSACGLLCRVLSIGGCRVSHPHTVWCLCGGCFATGAVAPC
jgi:hypothetical protein